MKGITIKYVWSGMIHHVPYDQIERIATRGDTTYVFTSDDIIETEVENGVYLVKGKPKTEDYPF